MSDRSIQREARARMAITGERYTTARAAVVARRAQTRPEHEWAPLVGGDLCFGCGRRVVDGDGPEVYRSACPGHQRNTHSG